MKKPILLLLIFALIGLNSFAQYQSPYTSETNPSEIGLPKVYFGLGSGLNYKNGLIGLSVGYRVAPSTIVEFNSGLGSYGYKVGLSSVFKATDKNGWCPNIGFSKSSGLSEFITDVEVRYNSTNYEVNTSINLGYMITVNAGLQRQFVTKSGNRFTIDLGYAIGMNKQEITFNDKSVLIEGKYINTNELQLSSLQKSVFQTIGPSGLTIGFSYNFGFFGL